MIKYILKGFSIPQSFDLWIYEIKTFHPKAYIKFVKLKKHLFTIIRILVPSIDK